MKKFRNMFSKLVFTCLGVVAFSYFAQAQDGETKGGGLFVEPMATIAISNTSVDYPTPISSSTGRADGLGLGGRLGFHVNDTFFVGADARLIFPQFKDSTVDYDASAMGLNWAPVVGVQMPDLGARAWGSYVLGGFLDPQASSGLDVKFDEAQGFRVGVGMRVSTFSVNLEYQQLGYGSTTLQKAGPFSGSADFTKVNLKDESWIASVSFPIAL